MSQGSAAAEPLLDIRDVEKSFGRTRVLRGISLSVAEGEFLTVLGESGSGKTTLLRLIAGFERPDRGEIWMPGERIDTLPPYRRRVNTVFQHYALFPHLTVFENVAYGLRISGTPKAEVRERVEKALGMVKMGAFSGARPPRLSGGQQQRVALARALVNRPRLLLLDEPLSALDANLRRQMQIELKALQREVGIAFVFITHDQEEAMALSDRIVLMHRGALEQVATPREIYYRPATAYTAQFIGQTNLLRTRREGGLVRCADFSWRCAELVDQAAKEVLFSLRPEHIRLAGEAPQEDVVRFRATLRACSFHGASELCQIECSDGTLLTAKIPSSADGTEWAAAQGAAAEFEFLARHAVPLSAPPAPVAEAGP